MTMTKALIRPSLLLFISLIHNHHNVVLVSADQSMPIIRCASGWTSSSQLQIISAEKINDGYCDCPLDGLDEVETGACSGSMDGMWAGIPPSSLHESSKNAFVCPQQPTLRLPPSRINDGICDCCDGADERPSSDPPAVSPCPDVCDEVLAEQREARRKLEQDYAIGSEARLSSIQQFQKWQEEMQIKIQRVSSEDIVHLEQRLEDAEQLLSEKRIDLVKMWTVAVDEVLSQSTLYEIVNNQQVMSAEKLGLFIISLCQLSGEASAAQVVNERCLPFDRASLDMGILWDYDSNGNLPSFNVFDAKTEESIADYAEKLILRLDGKDAKPNSKDGIKKTAKKYPVESESDMYGDDYHDYHYDDDYMDDSRDFGNENGSEEKDPADSKDDNEDSLALLLEKIPLRGVRYAFKEHAEALLASSAIDDKKDTDEEEGEDEVTEDTETGNNVDPMAITMARSTISKRLAKLGFGESSSTSAARFVAALIGNKSIDIEDLQSLAIMTMYHSELSLDDISEIIYTLTFPLDQEEDESEHTCSNVTPWCPPASIASQSGEGGTYPPPLIVAAAGRVCSKREDAVGFCSGKEGEEVAFPLSVPDGYYGYYEPQVRSTTDALSPYFVAVDSLQVPEDLTNAKKDAAAIEKNLAASKQELKKMKEEVDSSDASKYGTDGELFIMRDTCHTVESGKYEYELCMFGKATQRDIGTKGRGTSLGSWDKVVSNNGYRTLQWKKGDKCWNGPHRSAEVIVTCGRATKILSADEPETCRYVFTMESPIACDEHFKVNNSL